MKDPHRFDFARPAAWVYIHLKFLYIRTIAAMIRFLPGRFFLVETVGLLVGIGAMVLRIRRWRAIAAFARLSGSRTPGIRYIANFFIQWARDRLWCELFYEAPPQVRPHFSFEDPSLILEAARTGKGGVLLGAHYGPPVGKSLFKEMGMDIRQVIAEGIKRNLDEQDQLGIPFLKTARIRAFIASEDNYLARKSEKEVLRAVRKGSWMLMILDEPRREPGGTVVELFGRPFPFQDFAFKVAVRYEVPVLFFCVRKVPAFGYRLSVQPCGPIATASEGVKRYAAFLEDRIRENPYPWINVPKAMDWFSSPSRK